jgi:beta-lactam-binding protein with PASTA domain
VGLLVGCAVSETAQGPGRGDPEGVTGPYPFLALATGSVQVIRGGQSLPSVYAGLPLVSGDQIETRDGAEAVLELAPDVRAYLPPGTWVALSSLTVRFGEILIWVHGAAQRVRGYFEVETSGGDVYVYGTEVYVRTRRRDASYLVLDGRIGVRPRGPAAGREIPVAGGYQLDLVAGQTQGPFPADPREIARLRRWKERLDRMIRPDRTGPTAKIPVPDVYRRDPREAERVLARAGLRSGGVVYRPAAREKPGLVIDTRPPPGALVDSNQPVTLVLAERPAGPEPGDGGKIRVPDLSGRNSQEAEAILTRAGLRVAGLFYEPGRGRTPGTVIRQRPEAGTFAGPNDGVTLYVAPYPIPGPKTIRVPQVEGLSEREAADTLKKVGFRVRVQRDFKSTARAGTVIDQDPEAGAWWQAGDDVLITVADRPIQ